MALALGQCSFVPATVSKRFARDISATAALPAAMITEKQADFLRRSVHTFRRQIPQDIVALGEAPRP